MLQPNPMGPLCRSYGLIRNFRPWLPLATPSFKFPPREFRFPPHFVTELRSQAEKNSSNRPVNPDRDRSKSKRKVGLYVGYIGTEFRGLQRNYDPVQGSLETPTIEDVLGDAICAAGGISAQNAVNLSKVGWSRSSRTDKGVHSLSTVVSLKLLVDPEQFEADPEGIAISDAINSHLPESIRVFSAQRVNKGFTARSACIHRSYEYLLPARLLLPRYGEAFETPQRRKEEMQAALVRLRNALGEMTGRRAFHNYTKRSVYRKGKLQSRREARKLFATGQRSSRDLSFTEAEEETSLSDEESSGLHEASQQAGVHVRPVSRPDSADEDDEEEEEETERDAAEEGGSSGRRRNRIELVWHEEQADGDKIGDAHFRRVRHAGATEPELLRGCSEPAVRIQIQGESFMVHQIRHMVGAAVAVARGDLPAAVIPASLRVESRITLPRAPPHTLVLSGCEFLPFRTNQPSPGRSSVDGETTGHVITDLSGDRLELRGEGAKRKAAFEEQSLGPALGALLEHEDWDNFEGQLERYRESWDDYSRFLSEHLD